MTGNSEGKSEVPGEAGLSPGGQRIAWFSTLGRPWRFRSAAFTSSFLTAAPEDWDIELFVGDDDVRSEGLRECFGGSSEFSHCGRRVFHWQRASERDSRSRFDYWVYQLEDSVSCDFVWRSLFLHPGICFFHDLNLNHLYFSGHEYATSGADLDREITELFGSRAPLLGKWFERGWSLRPFDKLYVRCERELLSSTVACVFSGSLERKVGRLASETMVEQAVFPLSPLIFGSEKRACELSRSELGIHDDAFVIASGCRDLVSAHGASLCGAFSRLMEEFGSKTERRPFLLLFADDGNALYEAKRFAKRLETNSESPGRVAVRELGSFESLSRILSVTDVFVGLGGDDLRGCPVSLLAAVSHGCAVVANDFGEAEDLPVIRIPLGVKEEVSLSLVLRKLFSVEGLLDSIGREAREWARCKRPAEESVKAFSRIANLHRKKLGMALDMRNSAYDHAREAVIGDVRSSLASRGILGKSCNSGSEGGAVIASSIIDRSIADFRWRLSQRKAA